MTASAVICHFHTLIALIIAMAITVEAFSVHLPAGTACG